MTTTRKTPRPQEAGVIVLAGAEDFLIRRELERLTQENVTPDARAFDFSEFRASDVDPSVIWNAVITLPLLANKRVVILHLAGEAKEELHKVLSQYAANPSATTLLIIVQVYEERGTPIKLEGNARTLSFPLMSSTSKRAQWAQDYVREAGKELKAEAAEYIVSISSPRLSDIAAKLQHAILYSSDQKEITGQALMQISGVTSEHPPWAVEDAIIERHAQKLFEVVRSMEAGGEELLRLLAYQRNALMRIWKVGAVAKKHKIRKVDKTSKDLLFRESQVILGNKAFKAGDLCEAFFEIGEARIKQALVDLLDLEVRIKTGRGGWRGYYDWLWKLIAPSRRLGTSLTT